MGLGRLAIVAIASGFGIAEGQSGTSSTLPAHQVAGVAGHLNDVRIPAVSFLLDDAAGLSPETLRSTEAAVSNAFRQAGVQVRWINCSLSEAELRDPPGCQLNLDVFTLIVKILPDAEARRWSGPASRLGFCLDKDIYLSMPGVRGVAERQALPVWLVLGHALVHEAGHALLGPGHSHGVMQPHFGKIQWRQAEKGQLIFVTHDAHRIRAKLVKLAGRR